MNPYSPPMSYVRVDPLPEKPRKTTPPDWSPNLFMLLVARGLVVGRNAWLTLGVGVFFVLQMSSANADEPSNLGIVETRPQEGPVVESDQGFMVAYKQLIPGTDIEFEMVPVPGNLYERSQPNFPKSVTWFGSYADQTKIGFQVVRQLGELDKVQMSRFWDVANPAYAELIEIKLEEGRGARGIVDKDALLKTRNVRQKMQSWID